MRMVTPNWRLYILMRNDLQSMGPGRCMAQAAHAANALVKEHGKASAVTEWQSQTKQGFGTTIVLSADENQITTILGYPFVQRHTLSGWVIDPDYVIRVTHEVARFMQGERRSFIKGIKFLPETADNTTIGFTRSERTCAYILGTKDELFPFLGDLPLF